MKRIAFYFFFLFVFLPLSLLPFSLLYILSDLFFLLLFYGFNYRRKVTLENLKNSFPSISIDELHLVSKKYYRFLVDVFFETIKLKTISRSELSERVTYTSQFTSLFHKYHEQKIPLIAVMGHLGNWEWAGASFGFNADGDLYALYHPLSNKKFDKLMYNLRSRFGTHLIPMNQLPRFLPQVKNTGSVICFIADQTPPPEHAHWMSFLNQDTPFFKGPAIISKKLNAPLVFVSMKIIKRGYYLIDAELITEPNSQADEYEITKAWVCKLEKKIHDQPSYWLWSHRRWKHKRKLN